jgi:hypothetical protein
MSGLNLVRGANRTDAPYVVTEAFTGVCDGQLYRLRQSTRQPVRVAVESTDEQKAPNGEGRWIRYDARALEDGVYVAASIGPDDVPVETYFSVEGGEVRRDFGSDRRRAERELRRRS